MFKPTSIRNRIKMKNTPDIPKIENGLVQWIRIDGSNWQMWLKAVRNKLTERYHDEADIMTYEPRRDWNQPVQPHSLIRVLSVRKMTLWFFVTHREPRKDSD